jgi:flagellar basal body-associated protein FliL
MAADKKKIESEAPRSGRTGIALVAVALLGLGGWLWMAHHSEAAAGGVPQVKGALHLETFVLNLADPGQRSYLRVGIDLGLGRMLDKGEEAPVGQVRDTILGVLAESRVDELSTAVGKEKLKEDLLHALQQRVPRLEVEEVYFTEFLIQR